MDTDGLSSGFIDFGEYATWKDKRKFVRVDTTQDLNQVASDLVSLLLQDWKLPRPQLLISVTGGAVDFTLQKGIKLAFRRGLIKAAVSTDAWVVTGGTDTGVMKHVGKAVQEYMEAHEYQKELVVLGIAAWGCLTGRDKLLNHPKEVVEYFHCIQAHMKTPKKKECPLNPNHTQFILADNGTENEYGSEIKIRAKLEAALSEKNDGETTEGLHRSASIVDKKTIPVCVVLEGGPGTLKTVNEDLKHGIPVVIVQGSGRMADVLADVYKFRENDQEDFLHQRIEGMQEEFKELKEKKEKSECKEMLDFCMKDEQRRLIEVFTIKPGENHSLDKAILKAILKVPKYRNAEKLHLMQKWNNCDLASDLISLKSNIEKEEYRRVYLKALLENQTELVEQFVQTGVIPLQYCLKGTRDDSSPERFTSLDDLYEQEFQRKKTAALSKGLEKITTKKHTTEKVNELISILLQKNINVQELTYYCQLFLWCVLTNKREMAMLFWDRCKGQLLYALMAQNLLTRLCRFTRDSDEIGQLQESAKFFGDHAIAFLGYMYKDNEDRCRQLLVTNNTSVRTTVLNMAVKCENLGFVAHRASQAVVENVWRGKIACDASNLKHSRGHQSHTNATLRNTRVDSEESKLISPVEEKETCICSCLEVYKAPMSKFYLTCVTHAIFMFLLSITLTSFFDATFRILDGILVFWVFTFTLEELRQSKERKNILKYILNIWNIIDVLSILGFFIAYILRFVTCTDCMVWARIVGSISNGCFFLRVWNYLSISKTLGPKIVMIGQMMRDLLAYLVVLMLFAISFGVMIQAVLYPSQPLNARLFSDVLRRPYFQIYGELFLEELEGEECDYVNGTAGPDCLNPTGRIVIPVFLGIYILVTNVLILNLIIAMFSFTVNAIHENNNEVWRMQRYELVRQFYRRPILPPPLAIVEFFTGIVLKLWQEKEFKEFNFFRQKLPKDKEKTLQSWETLVADDFMRKRRKSTDVKQDSPEK